MFATVNHVSSAMPVVVLVAVVLFFVSRPIMRYVADAEASPWLLRILTISLLLHLAAAPAQLYVVDHFYHGIADWNRYTIQGGILGPDFRSFHFTLADANVRGIVNDGSVSIFAGSVMAIVGRNLLATFLVFSWLSFLGTVLFYRAFALTFRRAPDGHKRYAYLLFFLPSTIFWTADVSKESMMQVSLGLCAYGIAKVLVRAPGGFVLLALGVIPGYLVRPNELMVLLGGFAVALMVRSGGVGVRYDALKRIGGLLFMSLLVGVSVYLTIHYLHFGNSTQSLQKIGANNSAGSGVGFGSSGVVYHSSPLYLPVDFYTVLLDPLGFNAHGSGEYVASLENLVILGVLLSSLRQLRILPRAAFARPYVMMCLVYAVGFVYAFAALGNLGLIYRERVMLLPFMLVLVSIPRTPRGMPARYEWEYRRKDRRRLRDALTRRDAVLSAIRASGWDPAQMVASRTAGPLDSDAALPPSPDG